MNAGDRLHPRPAHFTRPKTTPRGMRICGNRNVSRGPDNRPVPLPLYQNRCSGGTRLSRHEARHQSPASALYRRVPTVERQLRSRCRRRASRIDIFAYNFCSNFQILQLYSWLFSDNFRWSNSRGPAARRPQLGRTTGAAYVAGWLPGWEGQELAGFIFRVRFSPQGETAA